MSSAWRVVDADGKVHEAPVLRWYEPTRWWYCGNDWATDARNAVVQWANEHVPNWTDVVPPNQPTRAEAIAAAVTHAAEAARLLERERCGGHADAIEAHEDEEQDAARSKGKGAAVTYHEGGAMVANLLGMRIRSGEPVPQ